MKIHNLLTKLFYVVIAIVVSYFYFIHFKYTYNFPVNDEFRTISTVIIDYLNADGFIAKLKVLFVNENESLQLFLKLANIITFEIFGEIRYDILGYIGQLSLLAFPIVIYLLNKKSQTLWFDLGITVLIVFNLQYYVLSFRHDTSFYYHLGLFGMLFSAYQWVKGNYKWAVAFLLLGIFNNTSSVLIVPVYLLDYVTSAKNLNKRYLVYGVLGFALLMGFFYLIYPYLFWLPEGAFVTAKAFLIILGNIGEFKLGFLSEKPYLIIGILYLSVILFTCYFYFFRYPNKSKKGQFYAILAMYFFISILAISVKRSFLYHHLNHLLDPRYKMFTFSLLLFVVLLWNEMRPMSKIIKWGIVSVFLLYNVYYMFYAKDTMQFYLRGSKINSIGLTRGYDIMGPTHVNYNVDIYNRLDSMGIAPKQDAATKKFYDYLENIKIDSLKTPRWNPEVTISRYEDLGRFHTVQRVIGTTNNKDCYVFIKSDNNVVLFPISFYLRNSKIGFLKSLDYTGNLFYSFMFLSLHKHGVYDMGLITREKDGSFEIKVYPQKTIIDSKVTNLKDEVVK